MFIKKREKGVKSFVDFAHKKFEELNNITIDLQNILKRLDQIEQKYNNHKHNLSIHYNKESGKPNWEQQISDFRR